MNCNDARAAFSERFDERIEDEFRRKHDLHLGRCGDCAKAWEGYRALFTTVRSLPGLHLEAPPPYPDSTIAFTRPKQRGVRWPSVAAAAAAVAALVFFTGRIAFEQGRSDGTVVVENRSISSGNDDEIAEGVLAKAPPSRDAGRLLKRQYNAVRHLGAMAELGVERQTGEALDIVSAGLDHFPVTRDAEELARLDESILGGWKQEIHAFASATNAWADDCRAAVAERGVDRRQRLSRICESARRRELPFHLALLSPVVDAYDAAPFAAEREIMATDAMSSILRGLQLHIMEDDASVVRVLAAVRGNAPKALVESFEVLCMPTFEFTPKGSVGMRVRIAGHLRPGDVRIRETYRFTDRRSILSRPVPAGEAPRAHKLEKRPAPGERQF